LLGSLVIVILTLLGGILLEDAPGAPAPKSNPYTLLYIPKKTSQFETTQYRRRQIALFSNNSAPFILFWAIRSLKNADLPSLPKKGKGGENRYNNEEDIAWLAKNLKVENLDGTGVLRIYLAVGSRREQALLVNAIVDAHIRLEVHPKKEHLEKTIEMIQKDLKTETKLLATAKGENKKRIEQAIIQIKDNLKRSEEEIRTLPRLLELADEPPE
jgi:hypothetical protein